MPLASLVLKHLLTVMAVTKHGTGVKALPPRYNGTTQFLVLSLPLFTQKELYTEVLVNTAQWKCEPST